MTRFIWLHIWIPVRKVDYSFLYRLSLRRAGKNIFYMIVNGLKEAWDELQPGLLSLDVLMGFDIPPLRRQSYGMQNGGSSAGNWQRRGNPTSNPPTMPPPHLNNRSNGGTSLRKQNWNNKPVSRRNVYREQLPPKETYNSDSGFSSRSPTPNKHPADGSQTESSDDRDSVSSSVDQGTKCVPKRMKIKIWRRLKIEISQTFQIYEYLSNYQINSVTSLMGFPCKLLYRCSSGAIYGIEKNNNFIKSTDDCTHCRKIPRSSRTTRRKVDKFRARRPNSTIRVNSRISITTQPILRETSCKIIKAKRDIIPVRSSSRNRVFPSDEKNQMVQTVFKKYF